MSRIALIFSKDRLDTVGTYIERAMQNLEIPFDHFCSSNMDIIPNKYDIYLRINDAFSERTLPAFFRNTVYWVSDVHLKSTYKHLRDQVGQYDQVFCFTQLGVEKLRNHTSKIDFVSFACDPLIHGKKEVEKKYDIAFVGTDGGFPRKLILQELRERYPKSFIGRTEFKHMANIYSASKIGFNFPIAFEGMTMRSFEICAAQTMQLMQKIHTGWAEDLGFKDGENIVFYSDVNHMVELLNYYLSHEEERVEITKKGYDLVMSRHTYEIKVKEVVALVQSNLGLLGDVSL